jgi:hypothetical protein
MESHRKEGQHPIGAVEAISRRGSILSTIIARCETIWFASEEGWIPKDEWRYWKTWVRQLGGSPDFRWTVDWVAGDYSEEFIALVREEIAQAVYP